MKEGNKEIAIRALKISGFIMAMLFLLTWNFWFKYKSVVVISSSMLPTLEVNTLHIVQRCNPADIKRGDIVVYNAEEVEFPIIHRVVDEFYNRGERYLVTRGDNNSNEDEPISENSVVGKVVVIMNWTKPILDQLILAPGELNVFNIARIFVIFSIVVVVIGSVATYLGNIVSAYIQVSDDKLMKAVRRARKYTGSIKDISDLAEIGELSTWEKIKYVRMVDGVGNYTKMVKGLLGEGDLEEEDDADEIEDDIDEDLEEDLEALEDEDADEKEESVEDEADEKEEDSEENEDYYER